MTLVAPKGLLKQLHCSVCNNYLSVAPITFSEEQYICGRCPSSGQRLKLLEALAEKFEFPCIYQKYGCNEILSWDDVREHENNCTYQPVGCLSLDSSCRWSGALSNMLEHFSYEHENLIREVDFAHPLDRSGKVNYLLVTLGETFLIHINTDLENDQIHLFVFSLLGDEEYAQRYAFNLKFYLKNSIKNGSLFFPDQKVHSYLKEFDNNKAKPVSVSISALKNILKSKECNIKLFVTATGESSNEKCPMCLVWLNDANGEKNFGCENEISHEKIKQTDDYYRPRSYM